AVPIASPRIEPLAPGDDAAHTIGRLRHPAAVISADLPIDFGLLLRQRTRLFAPQQACATLMPTFEHLRPDREYASPSFDGR
ncbi:hypothetical protein, partial [Rhodoplanes elegans]|uniref:hypothetical protein n=1 Tax=Rhodoplanes elegans TaxID=29408 RepID=UPI001A9201D3